MKAKEIIEEEQDNLKDYEKEKKELQGKWIKLPSTIRYIEFLDFYIKEKNKFIEKIKNFSSRKN